MQKITATCGTSLIDSLLVKGYQHVFWRTLLLPPLQKLELNSEITELPQLRNYPRLPIDPPTVQSYVTKLQWGISVTAAQLLEPLRHDSAGAKTQTVV